MTEYQIGATALRQNLTDVIQTIKEEKVAYVIETFGRPQAAIVDLTQYRLFQQYQAERKGFFQRLDEMAAENAALNRDLSEEGILALIEEAREEVWQEQRTQLAHE
jgi:PHD/YefM family antitoxin component YafN of YafNO toxin-antitoxin module